MQVFPNWYNQSPVVLGPTIQDEQKLKVQGFPTAEVESSQSWIYQTPTNPQGKMGENIHQTPVQNQKDIREQVITDPMSNEDKVAVISSSNLNQYQSSTEFAPNVYSQSATKQEGNTEKHHIATDKSKKYDFKNHPAFKETGINVSKDIDKVVNLANHKGRHTYKYHQEVQERLDAVVERYSGNNKLESAV